MNIDISIVVPTYKRKKYVVDMLLSLKGLLTKNVEVIVVEKLENNGKEYKLAAKKSKINFTYIYSKNASIPESKNIGVRKAKGKYMLFFDDDVLLKTKVTPYIEDFKDPKIAAVNGRITTRGHKNIPYTGKVGKVTFLGKFTDGYESKIPQEIDTLIGCNMCWRKDVFMKLGMFDEAFDGTAFREEADLSFRAKEAGYKMLFDPRVEIFHVIAESGGTRKTEGRIRWYFFFISNETYFFFKHWPTWSVPLLMLTRWQWALRCMFGFGREVSLRSISTPFLGFMDGYRKYKIWKKKHE